MRRLADPSPSARSLVCTIFFALTVTLFAAPLQDTYRLRERGEWQDFEVARDEVHAARTPQKLKRAMGSAEAARKEGAATSDMVLYPKGAPHTEENRRYATNQVAVQLAPTATPAQAAELVRGTVVRTVGRAPRWVIIQTAESPGMGLEAASRLQRMPGVMAVEAQLARVRSKRSTIPNDGLFPNQWHLQNTGQGNGTPGIDANVTTVWDRYRGSGVTIGVIDDGMERAHPDLAPNYVAALSYDFNFRKADPTPAPFDFNDHGTACSGLAAARGNNGFGVAGTAYEASLCHLRLIARPTTDAEEAEAFGFRNDAISIKSNSWGPFDTATILDGAGPLTRAAIADAVADGRGGRGTIITWACGNGGDVGDNSNYDGYANLPEAIAVGAYTNNGKLAPYSEQGANVLIVAPSSGGTLGITTTDRRGEDGYNFSGASDLATKDYTRTFGGTSAAAPIASGLFALILQANPQLGWRDLREILVRSAKKVNPTDPDWVTNGAGFSFNHKYGAGLVDTQAAVTLAETWKNLGPRISANRDESYGAEIIPDNNPTGAVHSFTFTESELRVEHVCVTVNAHHARRGQLRIEIESPAGTKSILAPGRSRDLGKDLRNWTFMSVHHWGENAAGTWKVRVIDQKARTVGTLTRLKVELFGSELPQAILPDGATITDEQTPDHFYEAGETVTVAYGLKNNTDAPIDGVTAALQPGAGVLSPSGSQDYGTIAPGETVRREFRFTVGAAIGATIRPTLAVTATGGITARAKFSSIVGRRPAQPLVLRRTQSIQIPGSGTSGVASSYPEFLTVFPFGLPSGAVPVITKVSVRLHGFTHERTQDVDILLANGVTGRTVMLMSDAGLGAVHNLELTFDDDAVLPLMTAPLTSGTFRPRNLGSLVDVMPTPVNLKPYGNSLSVFNGLIALDTWFLFIRDDQAGAIGSLSGWDLVIDYAF